ncbi:MAG: hypothetical protein CVV47_03030 [Spirochaetae bacterium HGW-Spirochaetae-3]|jgi:ABC-2 type transport system permease protein|nr:MAG: hypothetical protein CVV47_03030 [Spirochaetae bacterium HGW-Spirochaetae-3]
MSVYWSLASLYVRSFYNLPGKKTAGNNPAGKSILKVAGFGALMVFSVAYFGYLFVGLNLNLYEGLALAGMQDILFLNAAVMATAMTLVVGFMTALSTYYLNDMELQLLAMPIRPRAMFGAKFTAVYVSEAAFSLFFMIATMVVFGIKEGPGPVFYLWGAIAGLLLPLPPLAASYLVQIPLLSSARFLRNKKTIMLVGGFLGIAFALAVNVYFQRMMPPVADPAARASAVAGPGSAVSLFGGAYPPAFLAWRAMSEPTAPGASFAMLRLIAWCALGPALVIFFLSGAYARSLVGFNEAHLRKLSATGADAFIVRRIRAGAPYLTMVKREFGMMNREPMYLLNGPFIVVLLPLIAGVMAVAREDSILSDPDLAGVRALIDGGLGAALAGLVGAFLGSGTSIACTALSRDAKALPFIKSLPVRPAAYMLAKLGHALVFGVAGSAIGVGLLALVLRLDPASALSGLAAALALSSLLNLAGLWLDTANPRLSWDNPIAAMKQNPNSVIAMLGSMGLLVGSGYLAFRFEMGTGAVAFWFGAAPFAAFCALLSAYPRYAERRLAAMEA